VRAVLPDQAGDQRPAGRRIGEGRGQLGTDLAQPALAGGQQPGGGIQVLGRERHDIGGRDHGAATIHAVSQS
jgi:hypothetical protein